MKFSKSRLVLAAALALASAAHAETTQLSGTGSLTFSSSLLGALTVGNFTGTTGNLTDITFTPIDPAAFSNFTVALPSSTQTISFSSLNLDLTNGLVFGNLVAGGTVQFSNNFQLVDIVNDFPFLSEVVQNIQKGESTLTGLTLQGSLTLDPNVLAAAGIPAVPEPSTWALMGIGLAALTWRARRT